jgi:hypothetical protein
MVSRPSPNALDVCSYCNTHVFARARDAAMYGRLMAAEEQGREEKETKRQQAMEAAQREWAERRQRKFALSITCVCRWSRGPRCCLFVLLTPPDSL